MRFLKTDDVFPLQIECYLSKRVCDLLCVARGCKSFIVNNHFFLDAFSF